MNLLLSFPGCRHPVSLTHAGGLPVSLRSGESLSLDRACGARVRCDTGRLWITEEGCFDDTVLEAGQSTRIERHRRAVVLALGAARVAIQPAPEAAPVPRPTRWQLRFGPWSAAHA
jgi:Protein of unknown function (DUF2917)